VKEIYALAGPIPPPPTFALFADAPTPQACFLAQAGQAKAAIVIGCDSGPFYRWVAGEVQRYLRELTGAELAIVTNDTVPAGKPVVVLGGPKANPLSASAEQRGFMRFAGLKQDGFVIQTVDLGGQPAIVAGGNDEASTMYAAYELLERLGVAFQLTGDIIPQRRPDLKLPAAAVRMEPALKYRGLHMRHFVMPWMGLEEFRRMIDQMAKLKFNYLEFYWYVGAPYIECTKHNSSATSARCGTASDNHRPDLPCCLKVRRVPSSLGVPEVKANRLPLVYSAGQGWPSRLTNSGL
jgi:hypothetical protein